jgi:hypothetical protein
MKYSSTVSSSRRKARAAHFGSDSETRHKIMSARLSKELRASEGCVFAGPLPARGRDGMGWAFSRRIRWRLQHFKEAMAKGGGGRGGLLGPRGPRACARARSVEACFGPPPPPLNLSEPPRAHFAPCAHPLSPPPSSSPCALLPLLRVGSARCPCVKATR